MIKSPWEQADRQRRGHTITTSTTKYGQVNYEVNFYILKNPSQNTLMTLSLKVTFQETKETKPESMHLPSLIN